MCKKTQITEVHIEKVNSNRDDRVTIMKDFEKIHKNVMDILNEITRNYETNK